MVAWKAEALLGAERARACETLQKAAPQSEFILWGPEDVAKSRVHASDESVAPREIADMIVAQALLCDHRIDHALPAADAMAFTA